MKPELPALLAAGGATRDCAADNTAQLVDAYVAQSVVAGPGPELTRLPSGRGG